LSLAAVPGEVLALIGPNGAGKTTVLRALARLLRPQYGRVLLQDRNVWSLSRREVAQNMALSPQNEHRDWPLTVAEAVLLGRTPHRGWLAPFDSKDREVAHNALRCLALESLAERPITELSGGEWRRVVLARALAQEPRALLLDEPVSQLDLKYQLEVLLHLQRLALNDQRTVIVTLHDLNQAAICSKKLALLHQGQLIATGSPREVLTPARLREVYGVEVAIAEHPIYDAPLVVTLGMQCATR
jgi:iron complex transport system ATP-binding protein